MRRWDPLREFALILGMAVPGFLASATVAVTIEPIADGRWRPIADDAAWSLVLVTIVAYTAAGLAVTAASDDADVALGGGSIAFVFSLGLLVLIWIGLGRTGARQEPLFAAALWLQPILAIVAYLLGAAVVALARRIIAVQQRSDP
jgi:Flp pilus assembly protein protease CpaA